MKNRKVLPYIFFAIFVSFFVFIQISPANNKDAIKKETVKVLRVIDGDTIKVLINNREDLVRLIGIDSPETVDPRKTVECFGKEASEKAKEILTGRQVILESDSTQADRDRYNRLLRYVFLDDLNFNKLMISEGFAYEYTYNSSLYKYQLEFKEAEKRALENKKGLWADNICDIDSLKN